MLYRLFGFGLGVVLRSENSAVKAGDHVYAFLSMSSPFHDAHTPPLNFKYLEFQHYEVVDPTRVLVLENKEGLPWSAYVGVAGMPGKSPEIHPLRRFSPS